ncbi:hypothetical protein L873DRAFT_1679801 [Choiromyces venosus 120613-1]|uniref:Zn(2)-C6 fungal-type domain-containing protein n=1 Tax=Choiromyces venosus 120613-1 TaxID=1336337 RepID=A0A3N4JQA0_9PEZI|nr:hypothetical protein L873DRAFT_1679801 [Choiromyces venosus 120613-1]
MDSSFLHPSGSASTGGASASATTPTPTTVPSTNTATLVANNSVGGGAASTGVKRAHASSNAISNKSRSAANYPRKRAVSACLVCRGRKTKCDNQRPQCGFCKQTGAECVYEAEKLATFDAASLAILDKLSKIEAMLDSDRSSSNQQHTPTSHPSSHTSVSTTSGGAGPIPALPTLATCGSSPKSKAQPDASEIFPVCIATASGSRVEAVLQWPIFSGQFCVEDILAPVFENSHAEDDEDEDERDTWQERKGMMGRSKPEDGYQGHGGSMRKGTGLYDYDEKLLRQPPGEILTLVQRFFRNVHTKNPILDSAVLDGYAYEIEQHGFGWSGKSCLVVSIPTLFHTIGNGGNRH